MELFGHGPHCRCVPKGETCNVGADHTYHQTVYMPKKLAWQHVYSSHWCTNYIVLSNSIASRDGCAALTETRSDCAMEYFFHPGYCRCVPKGQTCNAAADPTYHQDVYRAVTPAPTPLPTPYPTPYPTPSPTPSPTPHPTPHPTPTPTPHPTPVPTPYPTPQPTPYPTPHPTPFPTPAPTPNPTPSPTSAPTPTPTPATTTTTTAVSLKGLDDHEKAIEIADEQKHVHECEKWCYSKKHKNKRWIGKKCDWFACSTCPECS
jgi:hypothetical protein